MFCGAKPSKVFPRTVDHSGHNVSSRVDRGLFLVASQAIMKTRKAGVTASNHVDHFGGNWLDSNYIDWLDSNHINWLDWKGVN